MVPPLMSIQITKDTKFKDLPDSIKIRLISLSKKPESLSTTNRHSISDFSSINTKISNLDLENLRGIFEQSVANCEAFKEGREIKPEDVNKSIEKELADMKLQICFFKESQDDFELLMLIHETIQSLYRRLEKTR